MLAWCDLSDLLGAEAGDPGWPFRLPPRLNGAMCWGCSAARPRPRPPTAATWGSPRTSPAGIATIPCGSGNCSRPAAGSATSCRHRGTAHRRRHGLSFWYRKNWKVTRPPATADWQRDLSISHDRIGDVLQRQGDLNGALEAYRAGMGIASASPLRIAITPMAARSLRQP